MKLYLDREWRRIMEEMGREHQAEARSHWPLGDALALCLVVLSAAVGVIVI